MSAGLGKVTVCGGIKKKPSMLVLGIMLDFWGEWSQDQLEGE